MTKVEAPTLEKAYELAAAKLSCSVTELQYEVIQYPSKGIMGLFSKQAIIVATRVNSSANKTIEPDILQPIEEVVAKEIVTTLQEEEAPTSTPATEEKAQTHSSDSVVEGFFESDNRTEEPYIDRELSQSIEESLQHLFEVSCFDIDVVEVDVIDNTAFIFIDGEDAALLIGKEGYRYNALSYMLFNWLFSKYQLYIKLEIAEFLTSQQEMIRNYIQPVIENVEKYGKAKTRFLDGILVQIALEQLREVFPDKYVAIKTGKSGKKFIVINDFHTKSHA
ncbi:RNA-binding protein Jag [hydrothermal vent metagenome]|uniref:RNA-binding protein Jag n=1 Tax=hydrothermal vent metagenome TaxID=652676 RepID=A0A1W1E798_9ZZZZ